MRESSLYYIYIYRQVRRCCIDHLRLIHPSIYFSPLFLNILPGFKSFTPLSIDLSLLGTILCVWPPRNRRVLRGSPAWGSELSSGRSGLLAPLALPLLLLSVSDLFQYSIRDGIRMRCPHSS
uniref:Uncharacterized protein n=1 Tax=Rhizophora mucronata TaxID=61149 RepID=A0A2P2KAA0_RHIMU